MNICFLYGGKLVTSSLKGTFLDGAESGRLTEAFGSGTGEVVSPVGTVTYRGRTVAFGGGQAGDPEALRDSHRYQVRENPRPSRIH